MLNCMVTCRGADKKPRDNTMEMANVANKLVSNFGGYMTAIEDHSNLTCTDELNKKFRDRFQSDLDAADKLNSSFAIGEFLAPLPGN